MRRSHSTPTQLISRWTGTGLATLVAGLARIARARRARAAGPELSGELSSVAAIDDPDGHVRLIRVAGIAELTTVERLTATMFDEPCVYIHIDLTDVAGWMPDALTALEVLLDEAEYVGFRIRVIGLDPATIAMPGQIRA